MRAGRLDFNGQRPKLVQAHIHFIGDIAQIAPASGGAAVVHLEVLHDARRIDLNALCILAANIENGAGLRIHHMGAEPVA